MRFRSSACAYGPLGINGLMTAAPVPKREWKVSMNSDPQGA